MLPVAWKTEREKTSESLGPLAEKGAGRVLCIWALRLSGGFEHPRSRLSQEVLLCSVTELTAAPEAQTMQIVQKKTKLRPLLFLFESVRS